MPDKDETFLNSASSFTDQLLFSAAVSPVTGKIIWVAGGIPTTHDKKIFENCGLKDQLEPDEVGLADKGYQGTDGLLTPKKKKKRLPLTDEEKKVNAIISTVRIIVERTIGRIKNFGCMSHKWRGDMESHWKYFIVVANLVNLSFDIRPLSRVAHPILKIDEHDARHLHQAVDQAAVVVDQ